MIRALPSSNDFKTVGVLLVVSVGCCPSTCSLDASALVSDLVSAVSTTGWVWVFEPKLITTPPQLMCQTDNVYYL